MYIFGLNREFLCNFTGCSGYKYTAYPSVSAVWLFTAVLFPRVNPSTVFHRDVTLFVHCRWSNTQQQTRVWSGFVYDRESQYPDCFRVVSSREMYRCQYALLYVWALGWSHFGKQKILYRMTSSGIKVNPIHNYSSVWRGRKWGVQHNAQQEIQLSYTHLKIYIG